MAALKARGVKFIDDAASGRAWIRIAFIHPQAQADSD
jgi:hypothetical protein